MHSLKVCTVVLLALLPGCSGGSQIPLAPSRPCCSFIEATGPILPPRGALRTGVPQQDNWTKLADYPKHGGQVVAGRYWRSNAEDVDEVTLGGHEVHAIFVASLYAQGIDSFGTTIAEHDLVDVMQGPDGAWSRLSVPNRFNGGASKLFSRVSIASVNEELNVCAVTASGGQIPRGRILRVVRSNANPFDAEPSKWGGGWFDVESLGGGEKGKFVDVGCAGVVNPSTQKEELHICGVTEDGHLWHAVEPAPRTSSAGATFSILGDVEGHAGEEGDFVRVDCAPDKSQLHLVGVTSAGRVYHTIRNPSGSWRPFEDVLTAAAPPPFSWLAKMKDVAIGYCNDYVAANGASDVSELNVIMLDDSLHLWQTIRAAVPISWSPFGGPAAYWRPHVDFDAAIGRSAGLLGGFSIGSRPFFTSFTLSVKFAGDGQGSVASQDTDFFPCDARFPAACQSSWDPGKKVTLEATTPPGSTFGGWSGACSGTSDCTVTLDDDKTVTATFNRS
jgi:hypothetical protein